METRILNNALFITIDNSIYNLDVLHKCFYWYGDKYIVDIKVISDTKNEVSLLIKHDETDHDFINTISKVKQDLIDFKLRDIVTKETKTVREIIVAKAFAYYDLNDNPTTGIADPVGFNPEMIGNE